MVGGSLCTHTHHLPPGPAPTPTHTHPTAHTHTPHTPFYPLPPCTHTHHTTHTRFTCLPRFVAPHTFLHFLHFAHVTARYHPLYACRDIRALGAFTSAATSLALMVSYALFHSCNLGYGRLIFSHLSYCCFVPLPAFPFPPPRLRISPPAALTFLAFHLHCMRFAMRVRCALDVGGRQAVGRWTDTTCRRLPTHLPPACSTYLSRGQTGGRALPPVRARAHRAAGWRTPHDAARRATTRTICMRTEGFAHAHTTLLTAPPAFIAAFWRTSALLLRASAHSPVRTPCIAVHTGCAFSSRTRSLRAPQFTPAPRGDNSTLLPVPVGRTRAGNRHHKRLCLAPCPSPHPTYLP